MLHFILIGLTDVQESVFLTSDRDQIRGSSGHIPVQFTTEAAFCTMDCSEEVQSVSEEPCAQMELKKGMSIFIDVSLSLLINGWTTACFIIMILLLAAETQS